MDKKQIEPGKFLETIIAEKTKEVALMADEIPGKVRETYSLYDFLKNQTSELQVIAEVKKASPSLGDINQDVDILAQAKAYEAAGAAMISVLTDPIFFKGDIEYLREISAQVKIPTLNKDFIIDKKQINRAVNAGATVILLIVADLTEEKLLELYKYASSLGLEILVETHNLEELEIAHRIGSKIIGINNRNLKTFEVSLQNSLNLVEHFQEEPVYVSESGIFGPAESELVAKDFQAILVGTALMKTDNIEQALKEIKIKK